MSNDRTSSVVRPEDVQDLIARGLAEPGVQQAIEMIRLSTTMSQDAVDLAHIYGSELTTRDASSTG